MKTLEDAKVTARVNAIGRDRILLADLYTSVSSARRCPRSAKGFEAYVIADACGDVSTEAHERALERKIQAGRAR